MRSTSTRAAGAWTATSTAFLYPDPEKPRTINPTEYYLVQSLTDDHLLVVGKVNTTYVADQNGLAGNYRYQFQNLAFNTNPMLGGYSNQVALVAADAWPASKYLKVYTAVTDPESTAQDFIGEGFRHITVFQEYVYTYGVSSLPGVARCGWAFSNKEQIETTGESGTAAYGQAGPTVSLCKPYMFFFNIEQYLKVMDSAPERVEKMQTGRPYRGCGLFGVNLLG